MPGQLQQIQVTYDQLQDRLVLTLTTNDFCEFQFWITRRTLIPIWNLLLQLLKADEKGAFEQKKEVQQIAQQIEKEKTQRQSSADKYAHAVTRRPFGNEPSILFKIMAKPINQGVFLLHLENTKGNSIELSGDTKIITAILQLISRSLEKAEWGLSLPN